MPDANTVVSMLGVVVQAVIALVGIRYAAKQSVSARNTQRWSTEVAIATAIQDKRQAWMDSLRVDIAAFLALSQEMAWTRVALFSQTQEVRHEAAKKIYQLDQALVGATLMKSGAIDSGATITPYLLEETSGQLYVALGALGPQCPEPIREVLAQVDARTQALLAVFNPANGARDHQQQELELRIELRLNREETSHGALSKLLRGIRQQVSLMQQAQTLENAMQMNKVIRAAIDQAKLATQDEMKAGWERIKRELAEPDQLLRAIRGTVAGHGSPRSHRFWNKREW